MSATQAYPHSSVWMPTSAAFALSTPISVRHTAMPWPMVLSLDDVLNSCILVLSTHAGPCRAMPGHAGPCRAMPGHGHLSILQYMCIYITYQLSAVSCTDDFHGNGNAYYSYYVQ
eukprot:scpid83700/ scgid19331/ 